MFRNLTILLAASILALTTTPVLASEEHTTDFVWVRWNDVDYFAKVAVPKGQMIRYFNGENCQNPDHRTKKQQQKRFFDHFHISYSLNNLFGEDDKTGTKNIPVSTATIKAFWDKVYKGYTRKGDLEGVTQNCHGYAFGYKDVWVQKVAYIDEDDLDNPVGWQDTKFWCERPDHTIIVDVTIGASGDFTISAEEKN